MNRVVFGLVLIFYISFQPLRLMAGEFGYNLYGLSYHFDQTDFRGKKFNEINQGVGFNYIISNTLKNITFADCGLYDDSLHNPAAYVALGYRYKLIDNFSLGAILTYYKSNSVNKGCPLFAPIPTVSYRYKSTSFNFVYLLSYKNVNAYPSIGFYFTFYVTETLPKIKKSA